MSTQQRISVDEPTDTIQISDVEIQDSELAGFLSDAEPDERVELVERALQVGGTALRLMDTSKEVEHVESRLSELERDLEAQLDELQAEVDETFGDEGQMQHILDEHLGDDGTLRQHIEAAFSDGGPFEEKLDEELGEDGERIQNALDPYDDDTPMHRFRKQVEEEIDKLRQKIAGEEARQEVRDRTHLKGDDFEETVQSILEETVHGTTNQVEYTGDTEGELAGRDVGDFVLQLQETRQQLVVEAKTEYKTEDEIKEEMEDAIRNRDADYGIFVASRLNRVPETKVGWFQEYPEQDFVVVVLAEDDEDEPKPGYLRMAYNWARMRAIESYAELGEGFDPERLQNQIDEIDSAITRFGTIRGHCTEIEKSRRKIEEELNDIQDTVEEQLREIETELHRASAASET